MTNIIIAILCVVICIAYWEWPRCVYIVGVTYQYSKRYAVLAICTRLKDAEKHTRLVLINRINSMDRIALIIMCHELGLNGLGMQPVELLREILIEEIKIPYKYWCALGHLCIHTSERVPLR
jgi:hypothetical protein